MAQLHTIIDCFNKMENSTLFTSLDLDARLKGEGIIIKNVHNFVYIAYQMGVTCRDKIKKPKRSGARFIYMKERSLTNKEITNLTKRPQCFDFLKQIKIDFKKRQTEIQETQTKHKQPERKEPMLLDKRKAERDIFQYLYKKGRTANTEGVTIRPPERMYGSIQEEIIDLLNISAIPLTTKQISNYLGISHLSVTKAICKIMPSETTLKYIKKRKNGRVPYYSCNLPSDIDVTSLYSIVRNDLNSSPSGRRDKKSRPVLKRMGDLLNTYIPNSKFTLDEFIRTFPDANKGEKAAKGTTAVFLGRAVKHGYVIRELIPKSGRSGPNINYVKILNIPEKEMRNVTGHTTDKSVDLRKKRKVEPIVPEFIDDKVKVNVPYKLVKDMEDLIQQQHERVTELKKELAEMFDENKNLVTQNQILNKRAIQEVDFNIDLSKYQDNLQQ